MATVPWNSSHKKSRSKNAAGVSPGIELDAAGIAATQANSSDSGEAGNLVRSAQEVKDLSLSAILVIDSDSQRFQSVRKSLRELGATRLYFAPGPAEAVELYQTLSPDLVLVHLDAETSDAVQLLARVQMAQHPAKRAPVLVQLGAPESTQATVNRDAAMESGPAEATHLFRETIIDFLPVGAGAVEFKLRVQNLMRVRGLITRLHRQQGWLEQAVITRTRSLHSARREVLERLALAAQFRDDGTGDHTRRVGFLSARTAQAMNLEPSFVESIGTAALLHDLGKIGLPDEILHKPGPLTTAEFEVVKLHPRIGAEILEGCVEPILQMAREIALGHHERFDGSGYPSQLVGEQIPLSGRIVAVCDVYDALTRDRVYRAAIPYEVALQMIADGRGTEFDPAVVDAFFSIADTLESPDSPAWDQVYGTGYLTP